MRDATLLDAALDAARAQPVPGRLHYADLAAFLAERDPTRFAPTPTRKTPHYTLWRTLDGADDNGPNMLSTGGVFDSEASLRRTMAISFLAAGALALVYFAFKARKVQKAANDAAGGNSGDK